MTSSNSAVADSPADDVSFAATLRAATASAHSSAENGGAIATLISGSGDLALYTALQGQLSFVYQQLEAVAEAMRQDPIAGRFVFAELNRSAALQADLDVLLGAGWRETVTPLPETTAYVERLRDVASLSSAAFVAHHYTRYLGDLSGGFAVDKSVQRHLGLTSADGRRFFVFDQIPQPTLFKQRYRRLLDEAAWSDAERGLVISETMVAYRLNTALQVAVSRAAGRDAAEQGAR